ncbi:Putative sodium-coupled neutral amino acid transporter 7 (Solute carrier family 38 member 7) [Durusdinium trenchii]|uniref:Sodium-coupled neutral amino acid transporter 7 (Solute carrier family 38 member 7) n=1 Tax=Durusdinium trenchii TaxID=1381693 RepID=A0ABP0KHZ7_9DINO
MNLTKNLIGAGMFSLPSGLKSGSVLPGLMAMVTVCTFCSSSFILIAFLCKQLRCESYREVFCKAFGQRFGLLIDGFIGTNCFFACVAYTILTADFLQKAAEGLLGTVPNRILLIICNTCCFMLPLSHAKDLSALRYTSMLGLVIVAFVCLGSLAELGWRRNRVCTPSYTAHALHLNMGIFRTVALCTGAFQAHYNAPRIFKQLGGDLKAHAQTVVASFSTALTIYSVFAVSGLGLFGDELVGNVLRNYDPDNTAIMMVWFGMAFAVIFTYPLVFTAAREALVGSQPALQEALRKQPLLAHAPWPC